MPTLSNVKVRLKLPFLGEIKGTWAPDESERSAAWELYVELITRVSLARSDPTEGTLRDALSLLYSLFNTTRKILREYGPGIAQPKGEGSISFKYLAIAALNAVLRPVLAIWHPLLLDYESTKPSGVSMLEHERQWERNQELRQALFVDVRQALLPYANLLAQVAGVPPLILG
jgi:hypothetical protein